MNNLDVSPIKRLYEKNINKDVEFESLEEYLTMSKKLLVACCNRIKSGLAAEMLQNEDMISNLATELMSAELSFNGQGTIYGYRKQIAKWVIFEYLGRKTKDNKIKTISIDASNEDNDTSFKNILPSDIETPEQMCIRNESSEGFRTGVAQMVDQGYITNTQAGYLEMYCVDQLSMTEIAQKMGVKRQAVSVAISRATKRLKENTNWLETTSFTGYN